MSFDQIIKQRYLRNGESTIEDAFLRISELGNDVAEKKRFYDMLRAFEFLPNSPTIMNGPDGQMSACFVLAMEDSLPSILQALEDMATIHKSGGGTGFNFTPLRPAGSKIKSTGGVTGGPIEFLKLFNTMSETLQQGGKRPGANMAILEASHPDIYKFIWAKSQEGELEHFNLSVGLRDSDIANDVVLLRQIASAIWRNGEPGVVFLDRLPEGINCTNPCGEQPLRPYESCVLGSINLSKMLINERGIPGSHVQINYIKLKQVIETAVDFLNRIIDKQTYPLKKIEEMTKKSRKIGLGVMGWADLLYEMNLPYNSLAAYDLAKYIAVFLYETAKTYSLLKEYNNESILTIAPTGTIATIAGCSYGIEPYFARSFKKLVSNGFIEIDYPNDVQIATEIPWKEHIHMQAAWQKHVDNAISKTINMPNNATIDDIEQAILLAHELGCKGLTIYRQGSREKEAIVITKERPQAVKGTTYKIPTACGSNYVTINEIDNHVFEIFSRYGKSGGCVSGFNEAIGRLASLALRSGVEPSKVVATLRGISCGQGIVGQAKSCSDACAQAIDLFLQGLSDNPTNSQRLDSSTERTAGTCAHCGGRRINVEGCLKCLECGDSRCS